MWEGMDRPLEQGGWDTISASPLPYFPDSQVPREMDRAAMDRVKQEFVARPCAARPAASTCWSCTAPTAICWRVSFRR
jgi:2,4-dienoyl-CoA reductase-like NADH-dependent reductase (Old Yellow Enzyme family)